MPFASARLPRRGSLRARTPARRTPTLSLTSGASSASSIRRSGLCLDREFGAGARERVDGVPVVVVEVAGDVRRMLTALHQQPHDEARREVILAVLQRAGEGRAQPRGPARALLEAVQVVLCRLARLVA